VLAADLGSGTDDPRAAAPALLRRALAMLGQFAARHQEGRGEGGAWPSASFIPPDPLAVQDEVPEFLGAVEAGSGAVVLSVLRTTTGRSGEGQGEGIDVGGVQGRDLGSVSDFGGPSRSVASATGSVAGFQ
jgi:hypothetical protein